MAPIRLPSSLSHEQPGTPLILKPFYALGNTARHVQHPSPPPTCSPSIFARLLQNIPDIQRAKSSDSLISSISHRTTQMISIPSTYAGPYTHPGVVIAIVFATVVGLMVALYATFFALGGASVMAARGNHGADNSDIVDSEESKSRVSEPPVVEVHYDRETSSESPSSSADIEVFEEAETPPQSPRRSHRRGGGYRPVDPYYDGGRRSRRSGRS